MSSNPPPPKVIIVTADNALMFGWPLRLHSVYPTYGMMCLWLCCIYKLWCSQSSACILPPLSRCCINCGVPNLYSCMYMYIVQTSSYAWVHTFAWLVKGQQLASSDIHHIARCSWQSSIYRPVVTTNCDIHNL